MTPDEQRTRMLRWYPSAWRERYGDEMTALLEDTYGISSVPPRARIALARAGVAERARGAGLLGDAATSEERIRSGSFLILCAWALYMVAGAMFGKFTDNWSSATLPADRWVPSVGFDAVLVGGLVGMGVVLAAALVVVPSFVRLLRAGQWSLVRRPVVRAVLAGTSAVLLTAGFILWAHHSSSHDRNGGQTGYGVAFISWSILWVVAIMLGTNAGIAVGRQVSLNGRNVRAIGAMALTVSAAMAAMFAGMVAWWASVAYYHPLILRDGIGNGLPFTSNVVPPTPLMVGTLMSIGIVLTLWGARCVATSLARSPAR